METKKDVVLVTKTGRNFGAVLQAYALVTILKKKGNSIRILYHPSKSLDGQFDLYRSIHSVRDLPYNLLIFHHRKDIRLSINRFQEFREKYFTFTDPYISDQDVIDNPPSADVLIVGSDQVWNPNIRFSPIYFLAFGNENTRRYSYSASIGIETIPDKLRKEYRNYLSTFNGISVRESTAVSQLREIGINSINTVDPTLLLDSTEWDSITGDYHTNEKYILVYSLYDIDLLNRTAKELQRKTGYQIKTIATSVRLHYVGDDIIWDAGPIEFINLIKNAAYIVTSSYHGMLFSINYRKMFCVIPPHSTKSRFIDLLSYLGLQDRIISKEENIGSIFDLEKPNENEDLNELIRISTEYIDSIQ